MAASVIAIAWAWSGEAIGVLSPIPRTNRGRCRRKLFARATRTSKESNNFRLGKPSCSRCTTPSTLAAFVASASRSSGPLDCGVGSPSVISTTPTRKPWETNFARVPPQPISTSSGCAPTAMTSSGSGSWSVTHYPAFVAAIRKFGLIASNRIRSICSIPRAILTIQYPASSDRLRSEA